MNSHAASLRSRLVPALCSLIATTCLAAEPLDVMRNCAAAAPPALHGLKALDAACPDLRPALVSLGLDRTLYEDWEEKLNAHGLRDVIELGERYSTSRWHGAPDSSTVPDILKSLNADQPPQAVSWWRAFKSWVARWLDHSDSAIAKWLKHLLEGVLGTNVSPGFAQAFIYVVTILTTLVAGIIIARELKAAGIAARFRRMASKNSPADSADRFSSDEAPLADENTPAGVLRALVRRLSQTGRLTAERSLTHRELIARSRFDSDGQRAVFAHLARAAESVLYGAQAPAPKSLEIVTAQARELLQQLSMSAPAP